MQDAGKLAENTAVLMNVSEFDNISNATDTLVSALQAYKKEGSDVATLSMDIINKYNEVGNSYAISTSDLANSLTRSSATLVAAGNSLSESIALTTAANATVQDPNAVGNALKVVAMRIRGTTVKELESIGEDTDGVIESVSKLQDKIKALTAVNGGEGIDIIADDGSYKSTYEILLEISKVFDEIDDKSQAALLELLAGKQRGSTVAAILQNGDMLEDVHMSAENADGSAQEELDTYMDSVEGRAAQLTNKVQTLWMNLLGSDVLKTVIDALAKLVDFLDTGAGKAAMLGLAFNGIRKHFNFGPAITAVNGQLQIFGKTTDTIKNNFSSLSSQSTGFFQTIGAGFKSVFGSQNGAGINNILPEEDFNGRMNDLVGAFNDLNGSTNNLDWDGYVAGVTEADSAMGAALQTCTEQNGVMVAGADAYSVYTGAAASATTGTNAMGTATSDSTIKLIGMKAAALAANAALTMGLSLLVSFAASVITSWFSAGDAAKESAKDIAKAAKDAIDDYNSTMSTLRKNKQTIDEVSDSYERLSKGVDLNTNENISLTTASYEEYLDICNKIGDMFPELVTGFDEQGNAILNLKGNVDQLTQAYDEATSAANRTLMAEGTTIYKDARNKVGALEWTNPDDDDDDSVTLGAKTATILANQILSDIEAGGISVNDVSSDLLDLKEKYGGVMVGYGIDQVLADAGVDMEYADLFDEDNAEALAAVEQKLQSYIQTQKAQLEASADNLKTLMNAYMGEEAIFKGLDSQYQSLIQQTVGDIDSEFIYTNFTSDADMYSWVQENIVKPFKDPDVIAAVDAITELQTNLSQSDMSYAEYKEQLSQYVSELNQHIENDEVVASIKVNLGVDEKSLETSKNHIASILAHSYKSTGRDILGNNQIELTEEARAKIESLSMEDLQIAGQLEVPEGVQLSWDELLMRIQNAKMEMMSDVGFSDYMTDFTSITESVGKYQDALEKLQSGSFTINDFIELVGEFPELAEGVDTSSDSFEGLSKNLRNAIKASPKSTIADLKQLREEFIEVGKSTKDIDQMINVLENIPDDALDGLITKFGSLSDEIEGAIKANSELQASLSENPNERYETRGEAMKKMQELMEEGKIGSESQLWTIAEEYGYAGARSADELAQYLAARETWFAVDEDDNYTYQGMENFANDIEAAVANNEALQQLLTFDYDDATGALNIDFDNKNLPQIIDLLGKTQEAAGLTAEEWQDMMQYIGQFFDIEWSNADDEMDAFIQERQNVVAQGYNSKINGNFDYTKTAHKTKEEMQAGGWEEFEGDIATTYDQGYVISNYDGTEYSILVSCVTPDGDVISPEDLDDYVFNTLAGATDVLEADKIENGGKGILINIAEGEWTGGQFEEFNKRIGYLKNQEAKLYQLLYGEVAEPIILSEAEISAFFDVSGNLLDQKVKELQDKYGEGINIVKDPLGVYADMYAGTTDDLLNNKGIKDAIRTYIDGTKSIDKDALKSVLKEAYSGLGLSDSEISEIIANITEGITMINETLLTSDSLNIDKAVNDKDWATFAKNVHTGWSDQKVNLDAVQEMLEQNGYTAQQIDSYLSAIRAESEIYAVSDADPLGLNNSLVTCNNLKDQLESLNIDRAVWYNGDGVSNRIDINVADLAQVLVDKGWTAEQIQDYIDQLNGAVYDNLTIKVSDDPIDDILAKAAQIPDEQKTDYSLVGTGVTTTGEILGAWEQIEKDKSTTYTVNYKTAGNLETPTPTSYFPTITNMIRGTHAQGTAHASGNWGAPRTETALTGELGPEMV